MEMTIKTNFSFGQTVYLKTDKEQSERFITEMLVYPSLHINYKVACGSSQSWHYDFELSAEKNQLLALS